MARGRYRAERTHRGTEAHDRQTSKVNNAFERVAVINLSRRLERWRLFLQRLPSDWPFPPPLRFPAVDGQRQEMPAFWQVGAGAWGCYLSHLAILEDCLANDISSVLIMEDDAIFVRDFSAAVGEFFAHLPTDWEYVYLGGQHIEHHLGLPVKVNPWVYRPWNVNRLHAYGIRGHSMLERVHQHLMHPETWPRDHHIDHRLGELHKSLESGLYVPYRWLVAQAEGHSNISDKHQPERMFWGAQALAEPCVRAKIVAVLGAYDEATSQMTALLHYLGISMGTEFETSESSTFEFEEQGLTELCSRIFEEPWMAQQLHPPLRTQLLGIWAAARFDHQMHPAGLVGAKHPLLCLLGPDIAQAWHNPYVVAVASESPPTIGRHAHRARRWPVDALATATHQLILSRDMFLAGYDGPQLVVDSRQLQRDPFAVVGQLASFLSIDFDTAKVQQAVSQLFP